MALSIADISFGGSPDRGANFGNIEMYRPMSLGADWLTLALGIQLDIACASTLTLGANGFGIGLSDTNPFMAASTPHCIGVRVGASTSALAASGGFFSWDNFDFFVKVNSATTPTNQATEDVYVPLSGTANLRACFVFVVQKDTPSAGTYTVNFIRPIANTIADTTETAFITALETLDVTNCIAGLGSSGTGYGTTEDTITVDEATNGELVSLNVWWPATASQFNMFAIAGAKWD